MACGFWDRYKRTEAVVVAAAETIEERNACTTDVGFDATERASTAAEPRTKPTRVMKLIINIFTIGLYAVIYCRR